MSKKGSDDKLRRLQQMLAGLDLPGKTVIRAAPSEIRIGRAERDAVIDQLRRHLEAERITLAEFEDRMSTAAEARHVSQLAKLTADLPGLKPVPPRKEVRRPPEYRSVSIWMLGSLIWLLAALIIAGAIK
jgi:hypothetical protein